MITLLKTGLRIVGLDEPEGWHVHKEENLRLLDNLSSIGPFSVRPRDIDPATFVATSRWIQVYGGGIRRYATIQYLADFDPIEIAANVYVYVYVNPSMQLVLAADGWPAVGSFAPVAIVGTDESKITYIGDNRHTLQFYRPAPTMFPVRVTADYVLAEGENLIMASAEAGMVTLTLKHYSWNQNEVITVVKTDTSANVVRVVAASGTTVQNATNYDISAAGGLMLFTEANNYVIINKWVQ